MNCPHCAGTDSYLDYRHVEKVDDKLVCDAFCENCGSAWKVAYVPQCVLDLFISKNCACDACKSSPGT